MLYLQTNLNLKKRNFIIRKETKSVFDRFCCCFALLFILLFSQFFFFFFIVLIPTLLSSYARSRISFRNVLANFFPVLICVFFLLLFLNILPRYFLISTTKTGQSSLHENDKVQIKKKKTLKGNWGTVRLKEKNISFLFWSDFFFFFNQATSYSNRWLSTIFNGVFPKYSLDWIIPTDMTDKSFTF